MSYVDKGDCWEWKGSLDRYGYGKFRLGDKVYKAHRLSYEYWNNSIPEGMCLMHECDNPKCVNPSHLSPGTHGENMADKKAKGRASNKTKRISSEVRDRIKKMVLDGNLTHKQIAEEFDISIMSVQNIAGNKQFKIDVEGLGDIIYDGSSRE
jgi:hypothetical protein